MAGVGNDMGLDRGNERPRAPDRHSVVEHLALLTTDGTPRAWLRAFMGSFIPIDDDSRVAMLMYVALHTESLVHPELARPEALAVPRRMQETIADQLRRGRLVKHAEPEREAALLTALLPSLCQGVLDGTYSADDAFGLLDYALDRVFR